MLKETLAKALNDQVNYELYSSYLYLAMSAHAERSVLKGAANWLYVQAREEMAHAIHMYQYILDRGAAPILSAIGAPEAAFADLADIFGKVHAHEQTVSARINDIATLAMKEGDHACYQFVMWYVNEQVEEEANVTDILGKLDMIGGDKGLLLNLDRALAARTYVNPFPMDAKLSGAAPSTLA